MAAAACLFSGGAEADDLDAILIEGEGASVALTRPMLEGMDQTVIETSTIWTDGVIAFSGVPLRGLLADYGLTDGSVELIALNDYSVTVPISELEDGAPIVATRRDHPRQGMTSMCMRSPFQERAKSTLICMTASLLGITFMRRLLHSPMMEMEGKFLMVAPQ